MPFFFYEIRKILGQGKFSFKNCSQLQTQYIKQTSTGNIKKYIIKNKSNRDLFTASVGVNEVDRVLLL